MEVIWSPRAEEELAQTLEYLEQTWGSGSAKSFLQDLDSKIDLIKAKPQTFPYYSKEQNIRKHLIRPQLTLYYQAEEEMLFILSLFNNYQDPAKRRFV